MSKLYQLRGKSGPAAGQVFDLNQPVISIGRGPDNDIVIDDKEISRFHARLIEMDGGYIFEDLNSTNGSSVNEKPASGHMPLSPGDVIALGKLVQLDFLLLPQAPADDVEMTMIADSGSTLIWQGDRESAPTAVPREVENPLAALSSLGQDFAEPKTSVGASVSSFDDLMPSVKKEAPKKAVEPTGKSRGGPQAGSKETAHIGRAA